VIVSYKFSPKVEEKFQWLLTRYPKKDAVLLPLLHLVQEEVGYLSPDAFAYVGSRLELSPARVREVASFYSMFKLSPKGKYVLSVCQTLSCYLAGSESVIAKIKDLLGIKEGETTPDGLFTLERVECLASCSTAPVMQVNNWEYHENLSAEKVSQVIEHLKGGKCNSPYFQERVDAGGIA
jgi:NADH-quinone oxidoreductase subunit E